MDYTISPDKNSKRFADFDSFESLHSSIVSGASTVIGVRKYNEDTRENTQTEITDLVSCTDSMDTRKSLTGLAQLILPALIDQRNDNTEVEKQLRNRRFPSNRLLQSAHSHIMRTTAGFKDMAERAQQVGKRQVERLQEKPPLCFVLMNRAYHKYGLKHLILILVFLTYTAFGASIFLLVEGPYQSQMKDLWADKIAVNREIRINEMMTKAFNNSDYLVYLKGTTTEKLRDFFNREFEAYENHLGIRWSEQKMEWDFWTALLFAGTICTTIGYGHIYPVTPTGKVLTMVFALFGIPLMLLVLQDVGKLLTWTMKFPWFQTKRLTRRVLRCCTKQSLKEMREIEENEKRNLQVFDLPIPVALSIIVIWVLICSFVLSVWDKNWTPLESFYFFFISLSTVGLGDLVPSSPKLLITMFGFILIGLSLVSMVINLLQLKMRKTYEAGETISVIVKATSITSIGILHGYDEDSMKKSMDSMMSRSTQTNLSLPGVKQVVLRSDGVHWVTDPSPCKSPDEVTTLVEMESGLRVCEQIGDNNNDEENDESLVDETDVLLEQGEDGNQSE